MGTSPMAEPDQHLVVRGSRFALDVHGEGEAMLFIHGFPLDRTMWRGQLDASGGFRHIAPDLRGFGRSAPAPASWSLAEHADDFAALLDGVAAQRAVVCGLS